MIYLHYSWVCTQKSQSAYYTILRVVLFTIAMLWNQPSCPPVDEWIKKVWHIYTMEYYLVVKKNEIMLFSGKGMTLEIIILSKISKTQIFFLVYGN
jgi:hypothetical protein